MNPLLIFIYVRPYKLPSYSYTYRANEFKTISTLTEKKTIKYAMWQWFNGTAGYMPSEECELEELKFPDMCIMYDFLDSDRVTTAVMYDNNRALLLMDGKLTPQAVNTSMLALVSNPNATRVSKQYVMERAAVWLDRRYGIVLT